MSALGIRGQWEPLAKPSHRYWTWQILRGLYGASGRHYHNIEHIAACLQRLHGVTDSRVDKTIAKLAIFWHDAVYEAGEGNNEQMSAELLGGLRSALDVDLRTLQFAQRCIMATKHADAWMFSGNPTVDTVLDIDLSILGDAGYPSYVAAVRREFHFVGEPDWRSGRGAFLREMLGRERIFLTDWGRDTLERSARENMTRELEGLEPRQTIEEAKRQNVPVAETR